MCVRPERLTQRKQERQRAAYLSAPRPADGQNLRAAERGELTFTERACTRKLPFRSKAAAGKWIKAHPPSGAMCKTVPYLCPLCAQWHTTKAGRRA